ncbi:MAG TPA: hypothetical protein VLF62_04320 [Candidatus Saccharimonadales bacterium]|nr:hypothetical protein [Candidatus Saccharimonadales bacterium]
MGVALAVAVALAAGGSVALLKRSGNDASEGHPGDGKGGAAGGLAPAVSPSQRLPSPIERATKSPSPNTKTSKTPGKKPSSSPSKTSGIPGAPGTTQTHPPSPKYDESAKFACTGLVVNRSGNTLHVTPTVTKRGNPDPNKFVTVADYYHGANPASDPNNHHITTGTGFAHSVDVAVPSDLSWQQDAATVFVAYYPSGNIPTDPNQLSIQHTDPGRVAAACGNAVITWAAQSGQMGGLGSGG